MASLTRRMRFVAVGTVWDQVTELALVAVLVATASKAMAAEAVLALKAAEKAAMNSAVKRRRERVGEVIFMTGVLRRKIWEQDHRRRSVFRRRGR